MAPLSRITAIKYVAKKRRGAELCEVHLDEKLWAMLDAEIVVREGLRTGQSLNEERQKAILRADEILCARRSAARRTALKPRSKRQLVHFLKERGHGPGVVDEAIGKLEENGTIDDQAVARRHLRKRFRQGGFGESRLREELGALGLDRKLVDRELREAFEDRDARELCLDFARKKAAKYAPLSEPANRRKLIELLRRRGFEMDVIGAALRALGKESDTLDDADEVE